MIQDGHTPLETYRLNCKMLQGIRPQELDYIIIGHCHCDHIGLLLYMRVANVMLKLLFHKNQHQL